MSSNPDLGHLYHDQNISSALTLLDVQEQIKTRAINARELKYLDKYTRSIDRAKGVCQRRNEWEQRDLRKQLKTIEWKTPSLNRSLRIESERQKNQRPSQPATELVFPKVQTSVNIVANESIWNESKRQLIRVSSWSVYSNTRSQVHSAPELYKKDSVSDFENKIYRPRYSPDNDDRSSKTANFMRKANQVTKTLHKLYSQSLERKLKERQTTVLDVLGKESKEELEKALFVLRGTPAGNLIEEILKDKEHVSKQHKESDTKDQETDKDIVELPLLTEEMSVTLDPRDVTESHVNDRGMVPLASIPPSKLLRKRQNRTNMTDVSEIFERDDTCIMSSTVANASDTDAVPHGLRWTDIFKTPELWKQTKRGNKSELLNKKVVSLVTLTGKRRQTMLTKR